MSIFPGYESAGVSYVNGEQVRGGSNANPYANANAPPAPADPVGSDGGYHRSSAGGNLGYPPYPNSNPGASSASGYPPYPQSTHNQAGQQQNPGYPPYPTHNRMPTPGQYPGYPSQSGGGYPQAGNYPQQYPGYPYQNYPNQNQRGQSYGSNSIYRRNGASVGAVVAPATLVGLFAALLLARTVLSRNVRL